ncbi:MAG: hypothetical protein D6710_06835 [Nitrospirae bacterium]|nr:MAG: hypothetical protein D6710_06835 [Nitrospirota bacterium]
MYGDDSYSIGIAGSPNLSVSSLVARVRRNIREFDPEYFTDEELLGFINEAHQKVYDELCMFYDGWFKQSTTISLVAGQIEYDLPTDFKRLLKVILQKSGGTLLNRPIKLRYIPYQQYEDFNQVYTTLDTLSYYLAGTKIGVLPKPKTAVTDALKIEYIPVPSDLTLSGNHNLPLDYARLVVHLATFYALSAEDEQAGNKWWTIYQEDLLNMRHDLSTRDESDTEYMRYDIFGD